MPSQMLPRPSLLRCQFGRIGKRTSPILQKRFVSLNTPSGSSFIFNHEVNRPLSADRNKPTLITGEYLMSTVSEKAQIHQDDTDQLDEDEADWSLSDEPRFNSAAHFGAGTPASSNPNQSVDPLATTTLYQASGAGFSGELARLYETNGNPHQTLAIYNTLRATNPSTGASSVATDSSSIAHSKLPNTSSLPVPLTTTMYNYILHAMLRLRRQREAFQLLVEMEEAGINPDRMTFEVLLKELSKLHGMERTIDELFGLMEHRYGIVPGPQAWVARVQAWIGTGLNQRAIDTFEDMVDKCPTVINYPTVLGTIIKKALVRPLLTFVDHLLVNYVEPINQTISWGSSPSISLAMAKKQRQKVRLTCSDYEAIIGNSQSLKRPESLKFIRFALAQIGDFVIEETTAVKILFYCSRIGKVSSDVAFSALEQLAKIYNNRVPRLYLETFLAVLEKKNVDGLVSADELMAEFFPKQDSDQSAKVVDSTDTTAASLSNTDLEARINNLASIIRSKLATKVK